MPMQKREEVLRAAEEATANFRNADYGEPEDNFSRIRDLWNAYLTHRAQGGNSPSLTNVDVANLMILMKVARLIETPNHKDSWIDIAGYAACGYDVSPVPQPPVSFDRFYLTPQYLQNNPVIADELFGPDPIDIARRFDSDRI